VYLVGPLEAPHSRALAAVLACGRGAVLSHDSAAVLWGLLSPPRPLHVTAVGRELRSRGDITVHCAQRLHPSDLVRRDGIPITSPARTLLDVAATATHRDLDRAANEARVQRLVSDPSLDEQFRRYPRHRGTAALRQATRADPKLTRSEAEGRMLALIRAARLPEPETNARVAGHEVDFSWRQQRLVVEVDGYAFHSSRRSFERDRRRDQALAREGWRVVRVTWRQMGAEPMVLVATLATALAP